MPERATLAKIHIAKKALALTDEQYRDMLTDRYGVASSKDLSDAQCTDLLAAFEELGFKPSRLSRRPNDRAGNTGKQKYEYLTGAQGRSHWFATPRQLRMVEAAWRDLARDPSDEALQAFVERQTGIKILVWLTKDKVTAVLTAMKYMAKEQADAAKPEDRGVR